MEGEGRHAQHVRTDGMRTDMKLDKQGQRKDRKEGTCKHDETNVQAERSEVVKKGPTEKRGTKQKESMHKAGK